MGQLVLPARRGQRRILVGVVSGVRGIRGQVWVKAFVAEPAALADCKQTVITLKWDIRAEMPGVTSVKIYTDSGKLFAHLGAFGSVESGPWVKPGSAFVLKSGTDDTELERLTIGGPVCP